MRYWAAWVLDQAEAQIGACYPVDADGAVPAAYLWAKTIRCPHCGGEVPLIKRRWLAQGEGDEPVAYRLVADAAARRYTVEILRGDAAVRSEPERGTMRGATAECIYCGTPSERERIVAQAQAGEMGQHLLAVVLYRAGQTGRDFRAATEADRAAFSAGGGEAGRGPGRRLRLLGLRAAALGGARRADPQRAGAQHQHPALRRRELGPDVQRPAGAGADHPGAADPGGARPAGGRG